MKFLSKAFLALAFALIVLPFGGLILWSLAGEWPWPQIVPVTVLFRGWTALAGMTGKLGGAIVTSVLLSSVVTLLCLLVSLPAARALAYYQFSGKRLIEIFFISPLLAPVLSIVMGVHLHFIRLGLADTVIGVTIVHLFSCLPYGIIILRDSLLAVGGQWEEQARVLGASRWQTMWYVVLPLLAPGLVAASAMVFIVSFSEYILSFIIGGGKVVTFSLLIFPYLQGGDRNISSALSIIFLLVILLWILTLELLARRYTSQGRFFHL